MKTLDQVLQELPPHLRNEVRDFAQFLLERRAAPKQRKLRQSWAGALSEFRDQYTSLELQKKALDWWGD
jgi:hypothetical protein